MGEQRNGRANLNLACTLACLVAGAATAFGQGTFSIDYQGPPIGTPDACTGGPSLTEGDILRTFSGTGMPGPAPTPCIFVTAGPGGLGLPLYAPGNPPGTPGFVEVDALSYGRDQMLRQGTGGTYQWYFSVDEWAGGTGLVGPPNLASEGVFGNMEASADIFVDVGAGVGASCLLVPALGNQDVIDGDGLLPFGAPGLGLIEPNPPAPGVPDAGTNLDALDIDTANLAPPVYPIYFSLDARFMDPFEGIFNSGSAAANGLGGGADILVTAAPGAAPVIWAPATALGLDSAGPGTDDIDALVIAENGNGVFNPSVVPFDWTTGATDMVMFSLRRGSATIGAIDSICGFPIEEGDILVPPPPGAGVPGIWMPADALGLQTVRFGSNFGDDLDALDTFCFVPGDANGDGVVDIIDLGLVLANFGCAAPPAPLCPGDVNGDGVVDIVDLGLVLANFGKSC